MEPTKFTLQVFAYGFRNILIGEVYLQLRTSLEVCRQFPRYYSEKTLRLSRIHFVIVM